MRLEDIVPLKPGPYDLNLYGPNGFLRGFRGEAGGTWPRPAADARSDGGTLRVHLSNPGPKPITLTVAPNAYLKAPARIHRLAPGAQMFDHWDTRASHHWYDFVVTCAEAPAFQRRFAGHGEDGRPSRSDPLLGRQA